MLLISSSIISAKVVKEPISTNNKYPPLDLVFFIISLNLFNISAALISIGASMAIMQSSPNNLLTTSFMEEAVDSP